MGFQSTEKLHLKNLMATHLSRNKCPSYSALIRALLNAASLKLMLNASVLGGFGRTLNVLPEGCWTLKLRPDVDPPLQLICCWARLTAAKWDKLLNVLSGVYKV